MRPASKYCRTARVYSFCPKAKMTSILSKPRTPKTEDRGQKTENRIQKLVDGSNLNPLTSSLHFGGSVCESNTPETGSPSHNRI